MYYDERIKNVNEREEMGRKKLESFLRQMKFTKIEKNKYFFGRSDLYGEKNGKRYIFEIKVRDKIYNDWIIEDGKMEALKIQKYDNNIDGVFYATFYDNNLYLYDVDSTPYSSSTIHAYNTTMGIGEQHKVNKYVHHYGFNNAWIFKYQNNSWNMISTPQFIKEERNETANRKEKTNQKR